MKMISACLNVAIGLTLALPAGASLIVTPAGQALGFTATSVITGLPQSGLIGPFGLTLTGNNQILVSDYANSTRYLFNDVDGQTITNALSSLSSQSSTVGYANVNGVAYGGSGSSFVQFNNDGTINHVIVPAISPYLGIAGDPVSGKLIATSSSGLVEINPVSNTFRVINGGASGDGVSISIDGTIAYLATGSTITGYNIATGAVVFSSNGIGGGLDGTGVISSSNNLNGFIVVNANDGNVSLINPITKALTVIATSSGQRGDYVSPDFTNGTLLLDFSYEVSRLSCGAGCSIGAPPSTPEPGSVVLAAFGVAALAFQLRRRTNQASKQLSKV